MIRILCLTLATAACSAPAPAPPMPTPPAVEDAAASTPDALRDTDAAATASEADTSPPAEAPSTEEPPVTWNPVIRALTPEERAAMTGVSWREDCPVGLDELRALELPHHRPDGPPTRGLLIAHADVAEPLTTVFAELWEAGFPITRMEPVRAFDGDDGRSMAADNTSAFNCRPVSGGRSWSQHAYGRAVDVNPLRNPFVRGERVDPPEGRAWLDRSEPRPGMIRAGDATVRAFAQIGWRWGGTWRSVKDYQHFSKTGT